MHFFSFLAEKKMPRPRLSILASPKILPQTQPPPQIATQTDYLKQILPDVTFRPQERLAHRDQERGFYRLDENDEFMVKRFAKTEMFHQEANTAKQIQDTFNEDPTLMKVVLIDPDRKTIVYQNRFRHGQTLDKFVQQHHDNIPPQTVSAITQNLNALLGHLHQLGITHGDVKPSNILINPETLVCQWIDYGEMIVHKTDDPCIISGTSLKRCEKHP